MTSQAALIDETIVGLKRALLRRTSEIAYDDTINQPSNRGNKTKMNAELVREGALGFVDHERFHRKRAEHSGYKRDILETNPPRFDAEGDELDFDDSDAAADAEMAEDNPFSATRLDDLLSPLTHPSDLTNHAMANAYTSKAITIMIERINRRLRLERHALWQAKNVYRQLVTDSIWIPCGAVELDDDRGLFGPPPNDNNFSEGRSLENPVSMSQFKDQQAGTSEVPEPMKKNPDSLSRKPPNTGSEQQATQNGVASTDASSSTKRRGRIPHTSQSASEDTAEATIDAQKQSTAAQENLRVNRTDDPVSERWDKGRGEPQVGEEMEEDGSVHPPRRMTTRAQASQVVNSREQKADEQSPQNPAGEEGDEHDLSLLIDPVFKLPRIARDDEQPHGLSQSEADETRRMLWAYIQKQGESVRLFTDMLEMLQKAKRMKEEVWEWCKAEAHLGEMSDGEDWYDRERWGLAEGEDLRKGADEEETEGAEEGRPAGKRGRGRRG